ncbi:MAG TPA: ChaN family lipoprotein, partial [Polyangiaceae bacterium]
ALNAERHVTRQVARSGIEELEPRKALALPSLDLQDREHREDFERRMQGHPGLSPENLERYYQAQVIWDEAMAERSAEWIGRHAPVRRLMIVAGQAHCQRPAIPARMERRGVRRVSTVLLASEDAPVEDVSGYDYALVVGPR